MNLRISHFFLVSVLVTFFSASGTEINSLSDGTLSGVLGSAILQNVWRIKQLSFRDPESGQMDTFVNIYTAPHQLTDHICLAERIIVLVKQQKNRTFEARQVEGKEPTVTVGACHDLPRSAAFQPVTGKINDDRLAKLFDMINSLIKTGAIEDSRMIVRFETESAKKAVRELKLETLAGIFADHDKTTFNFNVQISDKAPIEALKIEFPPVLQVPSTVNISLEDTVDMAPECNCGK